MRLPAGVTHHPRETTLIARDAKAIVRIDTRRHAGNAGYEVKERTFSRDIAPCLHGDWADFHRRFRLGAPRTAVSSGAEHRGDPKQPNITVVPNLNIGEARGLERPLAVLGSTMGHYHPSTEARSRTQEVYEFQSYGLMAIDREDGQVALWVASDGCKVAVPGACHMTLYNLGDRDNPLITLDFADPDRNPVDKELVKRCGPILLAYHDDAEVVFVLNRLYVNGEGHRAGVRLGGPVPGERERQVRIPLGARLELGRLLYERLTRDPDVIGQFARLGLTLRKASPEAVVEPPSSPSGNPGSRLSVRLPLVDAARAGTELYRGFIRSGAGAARQSPGPPRGQGIKAVGERIVEGKKRYLQLEAPGRPLLILVEGSGEWVTSTFRPMFQKKADGGKGLRVFYADDSRWKDAPTWTKAANLERWETYLDKADPDDFAIYRKLFPDVVFVVTPDFTHASIARSWLGRTPTVLVEKPFDSQYENVEALLVELGRRRGTAVLGLDHYQFYALPVHELKEAIEKHFEGVLADIKFYLTEARPIELGRERTLQYGLTLDLLPHCFALLTYFGDVATIDDIRVEEAGQYRPLIAADRDGLNPEDITGRFRNETGSRVRFTFQDHSGNGFHVPCLAVVGKGFGQEVKYLEVTGVNGNAIRVDLNKPEDADPASDPAYPTGCLFFLLAAGKPAPKGARVREVKDPYDPGRTLRIVVGESEPSRWCRPLDRARYASLLEDLMNGTSTAVASTLLLSDAPEIVEALDRVWRAIQQARASWTTSELGRERPVKPRQDGEEEGGEDERSKK